MNQILSQPATIADLKELEERLETRFEKKFATKTDLKDLEERLEIRFEKKFATKTDLRNQTKALRADILKLEERVEKLEYTTKTILNQLQKNTAILIELVGKIDDFRTENTIGANQIYELRQLTDNHEKRIKKLESSKN